MAQAVSGACLAVTVSFQFFFVENGLKQFALLFGKEKVRRLRQTSLFVCSSSPRLVDSQGTGAILESLERPDRAWHALAIANASLASHLYFKDRFAGGFVLHNTHVTELQPPRFVGP
jgi:hypothetical protein